MILCRVVASACLLFAVPAVFAETYSFGFVKHPIPLQRRLVPDVPISNASVGIMFMPGSAGGLNQQQFASQLMGDITRGSQGLRTDMVKPDYIFQLTVMNYVAPHHESHTEGKTTTQSIVGRATVNYALVRRADGASLASGTEQYNVESSQSVNLLQNPANAFKGLIHSAAPSTSTPDDALVLDLLQHLALRVASHIAVEDEQIGVLLAHGPALDDPDKLAVAARWNEFLEKLSVMPPLAASQDDAYRLYNIGLANEALAYTAGTPEATLQLLREASVNYTKAMDDKASERYFVDSQARIEQAFKRYEFLKDNQKKADASRQVLARAATEQQAHQQSGEVNNADIVEMVRAGVDPKLIISTIRTSPVVTFDTGVQGLIALSKNGVPSPIIQEMVNRNSSTSANQSHTPVQQSTPASRTRRQ